MTEPQKVRRWTEGLPPTPPTPAPPTHMLPLLKRLDLSLLFHSFTEHVHMAGPASPAIVKQGLCLEAAYTLQGNEVKLDRKDVLSLPLGALHDVPCLYL